jgi:hypothetical protein
MLLTLFHLGECHRFPSKWPKFGEGMQLGGPLRVHRTIPYHNYHFPLISFPSHCLLLGPLTLVTQEGHVHLISWEEGVEGLGGWSLAKDKSMKYKPSRCSPK